MLICRSHVLSPLSYDLIDWTSHLLSVGKLLMLTVWILRKLNVKVSLTCHEGSDREGNIGHSPLVGDLAELCRQICQLHALSSLHPQGNSLAVFSVREQMDPSGTEGGQKK